MRQTRPRRMAIGVVLTAFLLLSDVAPAAAAAPDTQFIAPWISHIDLTGQPSYDYNMSTILAGNAQYYWWCGGGGPNPQDPGNIADGIWFMSYNFATGVGVPTQHVFGSGPAGSWDDFLVCNPSVVGGAFSPFPDGTIYPWAMYYVATHDFVALGRGYNRIGVAFSQDGRNWRRWNAPVVQHAPPDASCGAASAYYGIGSPSALSVAYLPSGRSRVRLFYHDTCHFSLHSVYLDNGVTQPAPPTQVTAAGMGICNAVGNNGIPTTANISYEDATDTFYAAADLGCLNGQRPGERGTVGYGLFKRTGVAVTDPLDSVPWQQVQTVDTNLTGAEINSFPSPLRNYAGFLDIPGISPKVLVYHTSSWPRVSTTATAAQGIAAADPSKWDIGATAWDPNVSHRAELRRYQGTTHNITTGYQDTAHFPVTEPSLGWLFNSPQPGTHPIFNCHIPGTANYFNSLDPVCEGQRVVGLNGYAYDGLVPGLRPLYRCQAPGQHFVSNQSNCEGHTFEQVLGSALTSG